MANFELYRKVSDESVEKVALQGASVDPSYLLAKIYPIGSIYMSAVNTSPGSFLGGSWTRLSGDAYLKIVTSGAGNYGGTSSVHKIPIESVPSHTHNLPASSVAGPGDMLNGLGSNDNRWGSMESAPIGGGQPYYPYYYGVYVWRRIA